MTRDDSGEAGGRREIAGIWRALDASANRAAEALRVLEDMLRFGLDDAHLSWIAKNLRHDLATALARHGLAQRIAARDVPGDVGAGVAASAGLSRHGVGDVLAANAARAAQALRSLEESSAVVAPAASTVFESIRYRLYALERSAATAGASAARLEHISLCVLVDGGADGPSFTTLMESLVDAGVRMVQLRDKSLPVPVLVERVRTALTIARRHEGEARPIVLVNDRVDVAAALSADGVHVGADDMPVPLARRVVGPGVLVGRTAHRLAEARAAVLDGADYLGVGPCFPSSTKAFATHAPPEFIQTVCGETTLPTFAIGGITVDRIGELAALGVRRVAVASAVTRAADPGRAARQLIDTIDRLMVSRATASHP